MLWGIRWAIVERMLIDAPRYEPGRGKASTATGKRDIPLVPDDGADLHQHLQRLNRLNR